MRTVLKAIQYRNLTEARTVLGKLLPARPCKDIFDDAGEEPQGLLAVIPEDRLAEEDFHKLFGTKRGILVEVEKISYSGFGPPAEEDDYMGFVSEECAYVLKGRHLPIEIRGCPHSARDIHHLEALVLDGAHPLDSERLAETLDLPSDWSFDDLFMLVAEGRMTGEEIDHLIHQSVE